MQDPIYCILLSLCFENVTRNKYSELRGILIDLLIFVATYVNGLEHGIYYQQKVIHRQFYSFVFHNDLLMAIFSVIHPRSNVLKRARLILMLSWWFKRVDICTNICQKTNFNKTIKSIFKYFSFPDKALFSTSLILGVKGCSIDNQTYPVS